MLFRLNNPIKSVIYFIIDLFIKSNKNIKQKSLLLIRLDAIGDYILFKDFIKILKKSEKYKNYSITLLGNPIWKNLIEVSDNKFIDKFIWLERSKFSKNLFYRYKKLQEIASQGYDVIISPTFSRAFFYEDNIVKLVCAKEKIGSKGNTSNITFKQKNLGDLGYTNLIDTTKKITFEFYRNKEFFENLLNTKIELNKPVLFPKNKNSLKNISKKYAILFIGGSDNYKKWSPQNFAKVAIHLNRKYDYKIVICGSSEDEQNANILIKNYNGKIINFVGKTDLLELIELISKSDLLLSNETSGPHIAAALNKKNIFVIYNGKHFGRFVPYPKEILKDYHVIYHSYINNNIDHYKKISNKHDFNVFLNINEIDADDVIKKIDSSLNIS